MADTYSEEGGCRSFFPGDDEAVSPVCAETTFRLFQKWLDTCATTRAEFARLVRDRARDRRWSREDLESCLSWLSRANEMSPMPGRLIDTILDEVTVVSRDAAAVARRMSLLNQAGAELAKAAFRERVEARIGEDTHVIPVQRVRSASARPDARTFPGPEPALTPREQQILRLLGTGQSNRQISRRLGLAERTVKNHLSSLFSKLNATDRTTAVLSALRYGLISVAPDTAHDA